MRPTKRDPATLLPLTPAMFHVLIALADGEKHGYAVIKEVSRRTGGRLRIGAGTLYALIRRFLEQGVVEESSEQPDPALDDERRRNYRMTEFGRAVAAAAAGRLEELIRMARDKRLVPSPSRG
jgi:DNA-binding PadR family transcriptional regulator